MSKTVRQFLSLIIGFFLALSIYGCGGSEADTQTERSSGLRVENTTEEAQSEPYSDNNSAQNTEGQIPTAEYAEPHSFTGTYNLSDTSGYTYKVDYQVDIPTLQINTAIGKPGEVGVVITHSGNLTVTNTTTGNPTPGTDVGYTCLVYPTGTFSSAPEGNRVREIFYDSNVPPSSFFISAPSNEYEAHEAKHTINTSGMSIPTFVAFGIDEVKSASLDAKCTYTVPEGEAEMLVEMLSNPVGVVFFGGHSLDDQEPTGITVRNFNGYGGWSEGEIHCLDVN